MAEQAFMVRTATLDLPPLVAAFGRRLYWIARAVLVSEPAQVRAFDAVFAEVFGSGAVGAQHLTDDVCQEPAQADERPESRRERDANSAPDEWSAGSTPAPGRDRESAAETREVPVPTVASDEEVIRGKRFDALDPEELAQLYALMRRLALATPRRVVVLGGSPIARALARLAAAADYDCQLGDAPDVGTLEEGAAAVVVASHGSGEEVVLAEALEAGVPYVALVASPKRGRVVRAELPVAPELAAQLHTPAGFDIGARTPAEIAISILAEMVAVHHADPGSEGVLKRSTTPEVEVVAPPVTGVAVDPVCGMKVATVAGTPRLKLGGETAWFCGEGCRASYAREHVVS